MKTTFIYGLSDPRTDKVRYIGKSNNPKKRYNRHLSLKGISHKNSWISQLKSEGYLPTLEIIDEVSKREWQYWERFWIHQFECWGFNLTNMTKGGDGFYTPSYWKGKSRPDMQGKNNPMYDRLKGTKNPEHSKRISGENHPFYNKKRPEISKYMRENNPMFEQSAKDKISKYMTENNPVKSIEVRKKIQKTLGNPVLQYDLDGNFIREWPSRLSAERELGIYNVGKCCNGHQKTSYGFIWKWKYKS